MKEVDLPSGAKLKISLAPFADAKALYQAILEEVKDVQVNLESDAANLIKDLFCISFSSKKIEASLESCLKRATYNGVKIDLKTFEPAEARQDYMQVCLEVAKENILPFTKSLSAQFTQIKDLLERGQKSP